MRPDAAGFSHYTRHARAGDGDIQTTRPHPAAWPCWAWSMDRSQRGDTGRCPVREGAARGDGAVRVAACEGQSFTMVRGVGLPHGPARLAAHGSGSDGPIEKPGLVWAMFSAL